MATSRDSTSDRVSSPASDENVDKLGGTHVEEINTNDRVVGHPGYYEKGGLRTYGDDQDHDHEPPVRPFDAVARFILAPILT